MKNLDFNIGLETASDILIETAQDFEATAARMRRQPHRNNLEQRECTELENKAQLLRGQSAHILRRLKK